MTTTTAARAAGTDFSALGLGEIGGAPNVNAQTQSAERFLKMLVAQMQNQDPLNPMDNAQVTSQMAQINTVSGLEQVNMSVRSLNTALLQMQALQGAALVGRDVTLAGDRLAIDEGTGRGGFDLAAGATSVRVEVLSANGTVVDTVPIGPRPAGRHFFEWDAGRVSDGAGYRFRVVATNGPQAVGAAALMRDRVAAVSTDGEGLTLALARNGTVTANRILAFN